MATTLSTDERPNGPVAAAFLAGGIGSAALGIITLVYEISNPSPFADSFKWVKEVGALSGKTTLALIIFGIAWVVLHFIFRGKETNFNRMALLSFIGLGIGLLGTFPPFWHLFTGG